MVALVVALVLAFGTVGLTATPAGAAPPEGPTRDGLTMDWANDSPVLGIGSSGPAVVEWQQAMNSWLDVIAPTDSFRLAVDGSYGRLTDSVTRRFQFAQGIPVDGLVGPVTRSAYLSAGQLIAAGVSPAAHSPVLAPGDRGPDVRTWQEALNRWIAATHPSAALLSVDGIFGPATEAAVRGFQQAQGVTVDGLVGPETRAALASAPALVNAAPTPPTAAAPAAPAPSTSSAADTGAGNAPAPGICPADNGSKVDIVLHADVPEPRCVRVTDLQWLRVTNDGPATHVTFGAWNADLAAGATATSPLPIGAYARSGTVTVQVGRFGGSGPQVVIG
jgi:peptidoglycan hydrolase-like protein with peptidoglycan-binding domain